MCEELHDSEKLHNSVSRLKENVRHSHLQRIVFPFFKPVEEHLTEECKTRQACHFKWKIPHGPLLLPCSTIFSNLLSYMKTGSFIAELEGRIPTWKIIPGQCRRSLAFVVMAQHCGVDSPIVQDAISFYKVHTAVILLSAQALWQIDLCEVQ